MAFDAKGYRQAAVKAGIPQEVIDKTIADRTGVIGWLTGGKKAEKGLLATAGNILSVPSYAIGGIMHQSRTGDFGALTQGIKQKQAVMEELPSLLGMDPNSGLGLVVGFGGELLTPSLPVDKVVKLGKLGKLFSKGDKLAEGATKAEKSVGLFTKGAKKIGSFASDVSSDMSVGALRLSESSINAIEDVTKMPIEDFLRQYQYYGNKKQVLPMIEADLSALKKARTLRGGNTLIDANKYTEALLAESEKFSKIANPESQTIAKDLLDRAVLFDSRYANQKVPYGVLDELRKSGLENATNQSLGSVFHPKAQQRAGLLARDIVDEATKGVQISGKTLSKQTPRVQEFSKLSIGDIGRKQRHLMEFQERLMRAPSGRGNLKLSPLKAPAFGAGLGFGVGTALGNPLVGIGLGAVGSALGTNPKTLGKIASVSDRVNRKLANPKTTEWLTRADKALSRGLEVGTPVVKRTGATLFRVGTTRERKHRPKLGTPI